MSVSRCLYGLIATLILAVTFGARAYEVFQGPTELIQYDPARAASGYTLFSPFRGSNTYLIDMHGEVVHYWPYPDWSIPGSEAIEKHARLLEDGSAAVKEFGFEGRQGNDIVVVENTPDTHHMVVCTLCSCYPWPVLGLPPVWYKSAPYRARAVLDPRGVLAEFGVTLPDHVAIRVWDSTAEVRYLVLPMRPEGTDGMSEEALADLVTRDSMIGTGLPRAPEASP